MSSFILSHQIGRVETGSRTGNVDFNLLILAAFVIDLATPILITNGILPAAVRWMSQALLMLVIGLAYARMMTFDRIPVAALLIAGVAVVGASSAIFHRQGILETVWGLWRFLEFPLVGLFIYLAPTWSIKFPDRLFKVLVWILGVEVLFQVIQYLTGEPIGDHLAGSFGRFGVGPLLLYIALLLSLAFGRWLVSERWASLAIVLILGMISSVLGSMRIYPFIAILMAIFAIANNLFRKGRLLRVGYYLALVGVVVVLFGVGYNQLAPSAKQIPFEDYLNLENLNEIFGRYHRRDQVDIVTVDVGRNYALSYGWESIQKDPLTFIFGYGIGARGESVTLGTAGVGFEENFLGQQSLTSLLVILQEMGLFGIFVVLGFTVWVVRTIYRDIRRFPESHATEIRYGLLFFSLLWPIWLWYKTVLTFRVPMLLYWVCLGYVLYHAKKQESVEDGQEMKTWSELGSLSRRMDPLPVSAKSEAG